jgi:transcriptional regulator with XRE-family HTH domain
MSLNELASRIGMDPAQLDLMESQSDLARPTAENRKAIAAALDAPESVLFEIRPR